MNQSNRATTSAIRLALGSATALAVLARPILPALPLSHLDQFGAYLQHHGPVVTAAAGLRIVTICAAGYVLLIAVLALLVSLGRPSPTLGRFARAVTLPALRFALPGALGLCLLAAPAGARTAPSVGHGVVRPRDRSAVAHSSSNVPTSQSDTSSDDLVLLDAPRSSAPQARTPSSDDDLVLLDAPRAAAPLPRTESPSRPDTTGAGNDETATFRVDARDSAEDVGPSAGVGSTSTTKARARDESTTVAGPSRSRTPAARSARTTSNARTSGIRLRRRAVPTSSVRTPRSASTAPRAASTAKSASANSSTRASDPAEVTTSTAQPAVAVTPPSSVTAVHRDRTWTVEPGDHLWHIAHDTVATRLGHAPTDAQVIPYWERLIDVNRARLVDPDNPDLIFPGQVFTLP